MGYQVSVLNQMTADPLDAADVRRHKTVRLAKQADYFGFQRFWLAQDPLKTQDVDADTETLALSVQENTLAIRITSLSNLWLESTRDITEKYLRLAAKPRSRVDLVVNLLHPLFGRVFAAGHPDIAFELAGQLCSIETSLAQHGAAPEKFLIGMGVEVARLAGQTGWTLVYPGHLDNDAITFRNTLEAYRLASGGKTPILALSMFADESEALAFQKTTGLKDWNILPAVEKLFHKHIALVDDTDTPASSIPTKAAQRPSMIVGTGVQICTELDRLESVYGIEEFLLVQPPLRNSDLLASLELVSIAPLSAIA